MWLALAAGCILWSKEKPFEIDIQLLDENDLTHVVPDLGFDIALYDERSSWYLPAFLDDEGWGAVFLADRVLRLSGEPGVLMVEVTEILWDQPEPLTLVFVPSSEGSARTYVLGDEAGGLPDACMLEVTTDTSSEAHASALLACLRAWTDANGGPADLFIEVEASTEAPDWAFSASYVIRTEGAAAVTCSGQQVIDDQLRDEAGTVDIERLELAGWVGAGGEGLALVAWENTWDAPELPATAGGWSMARVAPRTGAWLGSRIPVDADVPATTVFSGPPEPVTTFPAAWAERSLASLEAPQGFVDACAVVVHEAQPSDVWLQFALIGDGVYYGGAP